MRTAVPLALLALLLALLLHSWGRSRARHGAETAALPAANAPSDDGAAALAGSAPGDEAEPAGADAPPEPATSGPTTRSAVIERSPNRSLVCEVVDRAGEPLAGALVALSVRNGERTRRLEPRATDAGGRLELPRLEVFGELEGVLRVGLATVGCSPPFQDLDLDDLPDEPVRFVADDGARLVVLLTDGDGEPLALDGVLRAQLTGGRLPLAASLAENLRGSLLWVDLPALPLEQGCAVLEHVAPGLTLTLWASSSGFTTATRQVPGPAQPGVEEVVLLPVEPFARARGRVVDDGEGRAGDEEDWLKGFGPGGTLLRGHVEQDGTFDLEAGWQLVPGTWTLILESGGQHGRTLRAAPVLDEAGFAYDFGELAWEPFAGHVSISVTGGGEPVADAAIEFCPNASVADAAIELRPSRWVPCDDEGRALVGLTPDDLPAAVRAWHDAWLPNAWTELRDPDGEVALELRPAARLTGSVLLPAGWSPEDLWIVIEPTGSPGDYRYPELDGERFRSEVLEPGLARLSVYLGDHDATQREIELRAGETLALEPIDLRGLRPFRITLSLAEGEPCGAGELAIDEPGEASRYASLDPGGRATFLARESRVAVEVNAPGGPLTRFEGVADGDHLVLPPAPAVRLRLPAGVAPPEPPLLLLVTAIAVVGGASDYVEEAPFAADGSARLRLPRPGAWKLECLVRDARTGLAGRAGAPLQTVEVPAWPEEPTVELRLAAEDLAALAGRIGAR